MTRIAAAAGLLMAVACQAFAWPLSFGPASGNRVARGIGSFPRWHAHGLATETPVAWLVALPPRRLAAVDRDGGLLIFEIAAAGLRLLTRYGGVGSADGPPAVVRIDRDTVGVVLVAPDGRLLVWSDGVVRSYDVGGPLSSATVPTPITFEDRASQDLLAVARDGAVVLIGGLAAGGPRVVARVDVRAMRDARITVADLDGDGASEAVVLADATDRGPDGSAGERSGAASVAVLGVQPHGLALRARFALAPPAVFDGLVPVLAPLGGSTRPLVLLARRVPGQGTAPVALALRAGGLALQAEGAAAAAAGRRRASVIGAADLSGDGVPEVVAVASPPHDGVLTAYRRSAGALVAMASAAGFAAPGPPGPTAAVMGDLDGDGRLEVALTRQSREVVVGLELRGDRFVERWALDFKSPITSNLIAADLDDDGLLDLAVASRRGVHLFLSIR